VRTATRLVREKRTLSKRHASRRSGCSLRRVAAARAAHDERRRQAYLGCRAGILRDVEYMEQKPRSVLAELSFSWREGRKRRFDEAPDSIRILEADDCDVIGHAERLRAEGFQSAKRQRIASREDRRRRRAFAKSLHRGLRSARR
jgi:hypothetical protein